MGLISRVSSRTYRSWTIIKTPKPPKTQNPANQNDLATLENLVHQFVLAQLQQNTNNGRAFIAAATFMDTVSTSLQTSENRRKELEEKLKDTEQKLNMIRRDVTILKRAVRLLEKK